MATLLSSIRDQARIKLKETTASFWTDAELLDDIKLGINDLWGALIDLNQEHYVTVDATNVTIAVDGTSLTGVPTDTFRVLLIEPRDITSAGSHRNVIFEPKDYNSADFISARALGSQDPTTVGKIYYQVTEAGSPVAAPTVLIAPSPSTAMNLRFVYVEGPGTAAMTASSTNPIPGESDNALIAWTIAYARSKERDDRSPDPNWLTIYATEKANLLTRMTPRQTQEPEVVEGMFDYLQ